MSRAAAVKKYLVEEFGIAAHLMTPRGYGETQPVATNETDEGRQQNRRVEVILLVN
jgi:OOP family OmpA-OmpF porin